MNDKEPRTFGGASPGAWWMLAVLLFFNILSFTDRYVMTMLVEPMKADLHASDVKMSLVLGPAFAILYGVSALPLGWLADRYPRRLVIYFGVTLWSLAATATGLARTFVTLLLARTVMGVGEASLTPSAYPLLADSFPRNRLTLALSIYQMGVKIGSAVAFSVGAVAIALAAKYGPFHIPGYGELASWQAVLAIIGAPGVMFALLAFTFSEPQRRAATESPSVPIGQFLRQNRALLALMAVGFCLVSMCAFSYSSWIPSYMTREFGWKPTRYGPALALINLIAAVAMVAKGWIVDWLFGRGMKDAHLRFYSWLVGLAVPVGLLTFSGISPTIFLVAYGVLQAIAIEYIVYLGATLQLITPDALRGRVTGGFMAAFTAVGMGAGPSVVAVLTDHAFGDEKMLGSSLMTVTLVFLSLAFVCLRLALRHVAALVHDNFG
jgi:MFS family permease